MSEEYEAPPVIFPGRAGHESAYQTAYDLLERRFPKEALEVIEPAIVAAREHQQNTYALRQLRAWAFMMRAQLGPAEAELGALVELDPSDVWSRHALGRVLERQSRYDEALGHLKLAAVMSDDYDHQAAVFRVQQRLDSHHG
jgi:tetratricopeptide (TPR) repeat protein